jgi:hypothetical protein
LHGFQVVVFETQKQSITEVMAFVMLVIGLIFMMASWLAAYPP